VHARRFRANPGRFSGNPFEYTPPDDHPLNHGDYENTAAINPRKTASPRQLLPQDFPQRHRLQAANLLGPMKTFTGAVTTAAPMMTFAAFFDELGGDVGGIGGRRSGHEAGITDASTAGGVERRVRAAGGEGQSHL